MDKTVPKGAAILLDFIGDIEAPDGYNVIFGNRQGALAKPLTQMTLDEVIAKGRTWSSKGWASKFKSTKASSAAGRYQFMNATLKGLKEELGLRGTQVFTPDLQDRLGYHLLRRRGYDAWITGNLGDIEFAKRLAQEWASLPVLAPTKRGKVPISVGQSYYAGDGLNKSLTKPAQVKAVLDVAKAAGNDVAPVDVTIPATPFPSPQSDTPMGPIATKSPPSWIAIAVIAALAIAVFAWQWFTGQQAAPQVSSFVSNSGGAPVPLDRPATFGLTGGARQPSLWTDIGLQILLAFVGPIVSAAATAAVGWIVYWWQRVLKSDFDQKSADSLHAALERGILAGIQALGPKAPASRLLEAAADYTQEWNGGTVKRFKLSRDDLHQLAAPHLAAIKMGLES
jgi:muramidase (phage lysozyme)